MDVEFIMNEMKGMKAQIEKVATEIKEFKQQLSGITSSSSDSVQQQIMEKKTIERRLSSLRAKDNSLQEQMKSLVERLPKGKINNYVLSSKLKFV